jgi:hypothetical protein
MRSVMSVSQRRYTVGAFSHNLLHVSASIGKSRSKKAGRRVTWEQRRVTREWMGVAIHKFNSVPKLLRHASHIAPIDCTHFQRSESQSR